MNGFYVFTFLYLKYYNRKTGVIVVTHYSSTPWISLKFEISSNCCILYKEIHFWSVKWRHLNQECFTTMDTVSPPLKVNRKALIETVNSNERYATWICNQSSLFCSWHTDSSDTGPTRLTGGHYRELIINLLTMLWSNIFKISKKLTYKKPLNFEICQIFARFAINVLLKWVYVKQ